MARLARSILMVSLVLGNAAAWAVEEPPREAPYAPRDPVVADVMRMSGAGVSEAAIVEWLQKSRPAVAPLTADDLIGLSQAEVPQRVISALIALTVASRPAEGAPAARSAAGTPPPAASAAVADPAAPVPVRWTVSYRGTPDEYEDPPDLALYVDGRLLVRIPGARANGRRERVDFARPLPAGTTVIRALRERHAEKDGAWRHEARIVGEPITIELPPGPQVALQIEYAENWLGLARPPLAWSLARDGVPLASREDAGGDPEGWAWLCEDTEASTGPKGPDRAQRYQLKECVRWASLWGGTAAVPARDAQLREFATRGFVAFVPE